MQAYDVTVIVNYSQVVRVETDDALKIEGLAREAVNAPINARTFVSDIEFAKLAIVPDAAEVAA